jgi:peptidase E
MAVERKPVYLIAGGPSTRARRGPDPLIQEALRLEGIRRPSVAYIGAASGDKAVFRAMISRLLREAGAGDVRLAPLCGARANPRKARRVIEDCDVVFLSGGDVEAGMKVLEKNEMIDFLRDLHCNGKPFFGISAGSIMLANKWVRWADPRLDSSAELFSCLGIADVYCDTHDEKNGWEELRALSKLLPAGSVCYGIPSGAALAVTMDGLVCTLGGEVHRFYSSGEGAAKA